MCLYYTNRLLFYLILVRIHSNKTSTYYKTIFLKDPHYDELLVILNSPGSGIKTVSLM